MRAAMDGLERYVATPGVSKHRIFVWMPRRVLSNQGCLVFARDDDYFFGVLHSRIHEAWARGMGTQLREVESGFRYTPTTTFETFPFPKPAKTQRQAIADAARELQRLRAVWLNPQGGSATDLEGRTLTNLYNERPSWLGQAHDWLDHAVLDSYGWPNDLPPEDLLAGLLELNLQRSPQSVDA
jgi:hypothetical protein